MKKIILLSFFAVSALFADYEVIKTKSVSFTDSDIKSKEVTFFGTYADYSKEVVDIQKAMLQKGAEGAMLGVQNGSEALAKGFMNAGGQAIGAGLGIGLVIGALSPFVAEAYADQQYIQIEKITLKDGSTAQTSSYFVGNKHPSYSDEEIKQFINK